MTAVIEAQRPCGLCGAPVLESHFRSGAAKQVQNVLYCPSCAREAEAARLETLAFKQSLLMGGRYSCGGCGAHVPPGEIRTGAVISYHGVVHCRACSRNLVGILKQRSERLPIQGARTEPELAVPESGEGKAVPPAEATFECTLCPARVTQAAIDDGRALIYEELVYCPGCRWEVETLLEASRESSDECFLCQACQKVVTPEDLLEDRAIRYRGSTLCATCKGDLGRSQSSDSIAALPVSAPKPLPAVPCARCERTIPAVDLRMGNLLEIGGRLHCRRCKEEIEAAQREREARAAKLVRCSHCHRAISPAEIEAGKIVYHDGNVFCPRCGKDPGIVLFGRESSADIHALICTACGGPLDSPDPRGRCSKCRGSLEHVLGESSSACAILAQHLTSVPCDGCGAAIPASSLATGRAAYLGTKTLCETCAQKAQAEKIRLKNAARCARCEAPLRGPAKKGAICVDCKRAAEADVQDTEALSRSGEISLGCSLCKAPVTQAALATGEAASVAGKLLCKVCRAKSKPAKRAAGKTCPTCEGPLSGKLFAFGDRTFCGACRPVFEKLLASAAIPQGKTLVCASCQQQAGAGGLLVSEVAYCKQCRRAADVLLQLAVRERRSRPARPRRGRMLVAAAFAIIALGSANYVFARADAEVQERTRPARGEALVERDSPASLALDRAARVAAVPPRSFEDSLKALATIRTCSVEATGAPSLEPAFRALLLKATEERDRFAPSLASRALSDAAHAAKAGKYEEALAALAAFPKELATTKPAAEIAAAQDRYSALASCARRALELLRSADPRAAGAMTQLLRSREAAACGFIDTPLGKKLDRERRRFVNAQEATADAPAPPPSAPSERDVLALAQTCEDKRDLAGAEAVYRALAERDPDSSSALLGLARVALEREHPDAFTETAGRAVRLARTQPEALVLAAWLEHLGHKTGSRDRARALLAKVPSQELGRPGRRLQTLLDVGAAARVTSVVRIYASGLTEDDLGKAVALVEAAVAEAAPPLGLGSSACRLDVFFWKDAGASAAFSRKLAVSADAAGHLPGCFACSLSSLEKNALRRSVGAALAARATLAPAWLVAALPDELAQETLHAPPAGGPGLAELEKAAGAQAIRADARLLAAASGYASLVHSKEGARSLVAYTTKRALDAAKARRDLEAALKRAASEN